MRIPEHIIDEVRSRSDIVDVIGEYVQLRRSNRNYLGLCPFHKEKTPSFNVNTERGIYKCFGCGKAGNVITFVEEYLHMGFVDAVKHLAAKAGVEIPEERREDPTGELARRDGAMRALQEAATFYEQTLASSDGSPARAFYAKRGFGVPIIETFRLGAAPAAWDVTMSHLLARGFTVEHLVDAGLVVTREDGKTYDRFRGRAMFAIADEGGRIVGFSARTLTDEPGTPKYVNSPQSIVFDKSRVLYGLHLAKRSIMEHRKAIFVEGQADVISMHQAGFTNTVASSGTALTAEQLRKVKRYADTIVLLFDSDEAGQNAITRGIELGLQGGFHITCVALPSGTDPDSLIRQQGASTLQTMLDAAQSWLDYQTDRFEQQGKLSDAVQQAAAVRTMLTWIAGVPDTMRHQFLVRDLAQRFRLDERYLQAELAKIATGAARNTTRTASVQQSQQRATPTAEPQAIPAAIVAAVLPSERELLRVALTVDGGLQLLLNTYHVTEDTFWSRSGQRIFRRIIIASEEHANVAHHIINDAELSSNERREILDILSAEITPSDNWQRYRVDVPAYDPTQPIRDAMVTIAIHRLHQSIDQLTAEVETTADLDARKRLVFQLTALIRKREDLRKHFASDPKILTWLADVLA